jgi:hypothetical protein
VNSQVSALPWHTGQCPVVHRTVSGAPGWPTVNRLLSGKRQRHTAIIHRTVLWCTGLSGEPTVGCAIRRGRVARSNGRLGTPDCPVCTGQCPVRQPTPRTNGRMHQIWNEIAHRTTTVTVRWCTRLSGAPPDRWQVWPSKIDLQRLLAALGL